MGLFLGIGKTSAEELAEVNMELQVQLTRSRRQAAQAASNLEATTVLVRNAYLSYAGEGVRLALLARHRDESTLLDSQLAHIADMQGAISLLQRGANLQDRLVVMTKCTEALQKVTKSMDASAASDAAALYCAVQGDLAERTRALAAHVDVTGQTEMIDQDKELLRIFGASSSSHLMMSPQERAACTFSNPPVEAAAYSSPM